MSKNLKTILIVVSAAFFMILIAIFSFIMGTNSSNKDKEETVKKPITEKNNKAEEKTKENKSNEEFPLEYEKQRLNAEFMVSSAFSKDDPTYSYRLDKTKKYIETLDSLAKLIGSNHYYSNLNGNKNFVTDENEEIYSISFAISNIEQFKQQLDNLHYDMGFNNKDLRDRKTYIIDSFFTLYDYNNKGDIVLEEKTINIIKTIYPEIDIKELNEKIDEVLEKKDLFYKVELTSTPKDHIISIGSYTKKSKFDDGTPVPMHIQINLQLLDDYTNLK